MNDSSIAVSAYRCRRQCVAELDPVCRILDATVGTIGDLPVLEELTRHGCFQLTLPPNIVRLNEAVFAHSRTFLDLEEGHELKRRHAIVDGSLNGYHPWGGLSKYNAHRRCYDTPLSSKTLATCDSPFQYFFVFFNSGFIFENRDVLDLLGEEQEGENSEPYRRVVDGNDDESPKLFVHTMHLWREAYHELAACILTRLSAQLGLEELPEVEAEAAGAAVAETASASEAKTRVGFGPGDTKSVRRPPMPSECGDKQQQQQQQEALSYFEREMRFRGRGQLHMKRCRGLTSADNDVDGDDGDGDVHVEGSGDDDGSMVVVRMPSHTDPSLISMVVHDRNDSSFLHELETRGGSGGGDEGSGDGAMGLEVMFVDKFSL
jgi:hypothetical protein